VLLLFDGADKKMQWVLKEIDEKLLEALVEQIDATPSFARLLLGRGLSERATIDSFLNPRLNSLSDPFLLPDMQRAVDRIWRAIDAEESIMIFGDYDVDGVTSTALLTRLLSELGAQVSSFIPDRMSEGYGFSQAAFKRSQEQADFSLLITVDCGINSVETVAYAQANGVDVIVTDHHEPDLQIATPIALVNPKLGQDAVLEQLAGVGVAFKLAHALVKQGLLDKRAVAKTVELRDYLDLVALGTVGDLVPLLDENRVFVRHGLARCNTTRWEGLTALKKVSKLKDNLTSYHLGFQLAPRINAAGRVGKPLQALALLTTDQPDLAKQLAQVLDEKNQQRRRIEQEITDLVLQEVSSSFDFQKDRGLVVFGADWHPGVVGIVASRVARFFHRPTVVLTSIEKEGVIRGSCRGIPGFDLLLALKRCEAHLKQFGGHKMAAGLELNPDSLESFKKEFDRAANEQLSDSDLDPILHIDTLIHPNEINDTFFESVCRLRPFGPKNHEPVFLLENAQITGDVQCVGKKHLKFSVLAGGEVFAAIAFNFERNRLPSGFLDFVFKLQENRWRECRTLQLNILDVRLHQNT